VVFDRAAVGNRDAIVIRSPSDNRVMFAIPWQDRTLVGTTDTYYGGDPAKVAADKDDIDYILEATNHSFPRANLTAKDVISTYAGLRPLVAPEDEKEESDISREDQIFESPAGLLSLGGGKLTTHRHVAERIVDLVAARLGRAVAGCRTHNAPLPGAAGIAAGPALDKPAQTREEHLRWRYGALGSEVGSAAPKDGHLGERLVSDCGDLAAEAAFAVEREMAVSLTDVMTRRLHVHLRSREVGEAVARRVAEVMAPKLGWSAEQIEREVSAYLAALAESRASVTPTS